MKVIYALIGVFVTIVALAKDTCENSSSNTVAQLMIRQAEQAAEAFWSFWPRNCSRAGHYSIFATENEKYLEEVEKKFRCKILNNYSGEWSSTMGIRLIVCNENWGCSTYREYFEDGRLIHVTRDRKAIPELVEFDRLIEDDIRRNQETWAKRHGMTYVQATNAYEQAATEFPFLKNRTRTGKWQRSSFARNYGRPLLEHAKQSKERELDRAKQEKEREEQRIQLLAIQNELKKAREESVVASTNNQIRSCGSF